MTVVLEVRNPIDLTSSYDQIEIERATSNSAAAMSNIDTVDIDTSRASDLSTGYTQYVDSTGTVGTHYYRFRYLNSTSSAVSAYSDIFLSGTTVLHTRFRNKMRDTNSNNYFFSNEEVDDFLTQAIDKLYPLTWFETYDDSAFVPDGTTEIFTFPVQVTRLTDLELRNSNGEKIGDKHGWQVRGRNLIFDYPPDNGDTIRAWVEKKFVKLSEVPNIWDSHIINLMRLDAYETLEADRARYYKYNTIAKPDGGSLPQLNNIITRIEQQIRLREQQLRRTRKPVEINLTGV
ncbi:MAG: hypothetical protein IPM48_14925 [Saprospiraceae bacterium]|nr:hypothetical protein [Saprospiraceae bacterium]